MSYPAPQPADPLSQAQPTNDPPSSSEPVRHTEPSSDSTDPISKPSSNNQPNTVDSVNIQSLCNAAVESYRAACFTKTMAILKLLQIIASAGPTAPGDAVYKAFEPYVKILDNFNAFCNAAGEQGGTLANELQDYVQLIRRLFTSIPAEHLLR
ncbi:hypothetical protein CVT26_000344 [Gymnopilus dilepis]|uniref:Uncharacterized protein n=1 Tax=Gymnopilus dilepis TaxID=231916 RepID=A0A409VHJ2_9AGAR|nr:hypothetical protein CVT26_000344 [Gymnopilus dilepis]